MMKLEKKIIKGRVRLEEYVLVSSGKSDKEIRGKIIATNKVFHVKK